MSNLSIFDKKWIDVVFDGKNQEYGAYQLRQENQKTSLTAFAFGTMIVLGALGIFTLSSFFSVDKVAEPENIAPIVVCKFHFPDKVIPIIETVKPKSTKTFTEDTILINPIVAAASQAVSNIAKTIDNSNLTNNPSTSPSTTPTPGGDTTVVGLIDTTPKVPDNRVKTTKELDSQPSFPNGIQKFYNYIAVNFSKPEIEGENTITLKVSFIVEKDGSMSNIKVLDDPGYGLGAEAIRVFKSLKTKWNPGILDGEPMRTAFNLPIAIQLE